MLGAVYSLCLTRERRVQLLSPMVHLLRPTRRKRGAQPSAPLPDFEPFTADDFRLSSGGLEPPQVSESAEASAFRIRN